MKKIKAEYSHALLSMFDTSSSFSQSSLVVHFHSKHTALVRLGPVRSTLGSSQALYNHMWVLVGMGWRVYTSVNHKSLFQLVPYLDIGWASLENPMLIPTRHNIYPGC